jgi:hypothetical protein
MESNTSPSHDGETSHTDPPSQFKDSKYTFARYMTGTFSNKPLDGLAPSSMTLDIEVRLFNLNAASELHQYASSTSSFEIVSPTRISNSEAPLSTSVTLHAQRFGTPTLLQRHDDSTPVCFRGNGLRACYAPMHSCNCSPSLKTLQCIHAPAAHH